MVICKCVIIMKADLCDALIVGGSWFFQVLPVAAGLMIPYDLESPQSAPTLLAVCFSIESRLHFHHVSEFPTAHLFLVLRLANNVNREYLGDRASLLNAVADLVKSYGAVETLWRAYSFWSHSGSC